MARAVEEITTAGGVEVEENAGDDNDLFRQAGLEEVEAVSNGLGESLEVKPPVTMVSTLARELSCVSSYR